MKIKHFALGACALFVLISGASHADTFEPKSISIGVDYRIHFGGSARVKPEAPTFGFNVNLAPAQDAFSMMSVRPTVSYKPVEANSLMDIRFDSRTQEVRNMYVGGVGVLQKITRVNVDGAPGVVDTVISWPLVATGFVTFYAYAESQNKPKPAPPAPAPSCASFAGHSDASMGIAPCVLFSD
ncbi:hypothetical protein [Rhodoferax aquaticus]|uniref:Outer membrane protein beta-barrel domain-containing protein n=1 Tax=Rhodoferax aquaticus TaxID=2527691 RepID=A0A515EP97_9BURK|nr:hypothetical protein [Rhodoferax aquaticus]QDL54445.1 hypothetical protein EXZ61_09880 [Rhodoferax aquaticus]